MLQNQGLLGIAFFEATAFIILLVLFFLFRRDHHLGQFRFWLAGWCCLTLSSLCEVAFLIRPIPALNLMLLASQAAALLLFLVWVVQCVTGSDRRITSLLPLMGLVLAGIYYVERRGAHQFASPHWETAILESVIYLFAGWLMLRPTMARRDKEL